MSHGSRSRRSIQACTRSVGPPGVLVGAAARSHMARGGGVGPGPDRTGLTAPVRIATRTGSIPASGKRLRAESQWQGPDANHLCSTQDQGLATALQTSAGAHVQTT